MQLLILFLTTKDSGLLRKLAMTIHVAVIARYEAIQKTQNINVLQNLSSVVAYEREFSNKQRDDKVYYR